LFTRCSQEKEEGKSMGAVAKNSISQLMPAAAQPASWTFQETAIDVTKKRLGASAKQARWLVADITKVQLEPNTYDVWHDRAVFHFLTMPEQRAAYDSIAIAASNEWCS
jgi:hypothetical protein